MLNQNYLLLLGLIYLIYNFPNLLIYTFITIFILAGIIVIRMKEMSMERRRQVLEYTMSLLEIGFRQRRLNYDQITPLLYMLFN